ncbi:glycosyltransferase family 2 protein [Clostridium sp.]|uniref:glycosyltransferase family 2 protein n=1 Tax=Clostridium sp. TaxID=1506 RepID=UPI002FC7F62B
MITISLCMIVKDEEHCIGNCLNSVRDVVDEIIIVDTGSMDKTKEIVKEYTEKIYDFQWINDFSAARNYSFNLATCEYILWLDADDVILEEDRSKLKQLKNTLDKSIDYVNMIYDITFNKEGKCSLSTLRERLVKNFQGFYWDCFMHEKLNVWGEGKYVDIHVTHKKNHHENKRNLENFQNKMKEGYFFNTRESYFYGSELFLGGYYDDAIRVLEDFTNKDYNNNFEKINALLMLSDCYDTKQEYKKAIDCCFKTFSHDIPKVDVLYKIANLFQRLKKYQEAIFWYKVLLSLGSIDDNLKNEEFGWVRYLPHQQLVLCFYESGDIESANFHNEIAAKYLPIDSSILHNREFFKGLLKI